METQKVSVEFRAKAPEFEAASPKFCGNCTRASTKLGEVRLNFDVLHSGNYNKKKNETEILLTTCILQLLYVLTKHRLAWRMVKAFVASVAILSVLVCV